MDNLLLPDKRQAPMLYDVEFRGKKERTVSIRGGLTFPGAERPGYFCLVAQLEQPQTAWKSSPEDKTIRFLAFAEGQANLMKTFFEKIVDVCRTWRIDSFRHGDNPGDESFSNQLSSCLFNKKEGSEIIQNPSVYKSGRCQEIDFLVQLVKSRLDEKRLLLYNLTDGRTPLLIDKLRNTNLESNIMEIPEIKALAYVMDDFDVSPWSPPQKDEKRESTSPRVL